MEASGPLRGPHIQIVDSQSPAVPPVDASQDLRFDREAQGFEDVNAYFHIDAAQRHLQSLGFVGDRAIAPYVIEVDTHAASGSDNSFFAGSVASPGKGTLFFGEGGTDDAEDSDLLVHEYGHAIHEWISPGTFLGGYNTQARAIGEAFGDYLAMSASYSAAIASGRDPFCIADWDARCWNDASSELCGYPAGSDCLRRVDSGRTMADLSDLNAPGTEHRNGEIWSSALRTMFVALTERHGIESGRRISDTVVIEALFGVPPNVSFEGVATRMIAVDRFLNRGANADIICAAMTARGILDGCGVMPRGELTVFQSPQHGADIPDALSSGVTLSTFVTDERPIERVFVNVNIEHPSRGDLRIALLAPDGTEFVLQNTTFARAADVRATFGRDAIPAQSLDPLRGRFLPGEWKLQVSDFFVRDAGRVLSWSLIIQFAGDEPLEVRPPSGEQRRYIPVVGHTPGVDGRFFRSELRLINPASRASAAVLTFTPSAADGRVDFGLVDLELAPGATVVFDDVVRDLFNTSGTGQIEIGGDVLATSRTYIDGTFGEIVPAEAATSGQNTLLIPVLHSARSSVGFAEVSGGSGVVRVWFYNATTGVLAEALDVNVLPFSHGQFPAPSVSGGMWAAVRVVEGSAAVVAYGSGADPVSGDPWFVRGSPTTVVAPGALAPAIDAPGVDGAWRTELSITNVSTAEFRGDVSYIDGGTGDEIPVFTSLVGAQRAVTLPVVYPRGILRTGENNTAFVLARIFSTAGGRGHFVPFEVPESRARNLLYVESSESFRTNIGLLTDIDSIVHVTLIDGAGVEVSREDYVLQPLRIFQFTVPDRIVNGRARVEVLSGRVYPYASVIDNRTGDPSFVRPE
jgi:subtilisin-like proprotein convertase family protein